jgi:hypothetical protein
MTSESLLEAAPVPTRAPAVRPLRALSAAPVEGRHIRMEDPNATAQLIVELCSWAARRRTRDPAVGEIFDQAARRAVCRFVADAISSDGRSGPSRGSKGGRDGRCTELAGAVLGEGSFHSQPGYGGERRGRFSSSTSGHFAPGAERLRRPPSRATG